MIKHYPSISDLMADFHRVGPGCRYWSETTKRYGNRDFYGPETYEDTLRFCTDGNTGLVPQAEAIMDKLDANIEVPRKTIEACIAGGWPDVPSFLAGHPLSMRRMVSLPSESAPINIYVTTTSTWNVEPKTLMKRGVAILALVMALTRNRAVNLCTITNLNGNRDRTDETVLITKINTTPLDLATACYMLTSSGFDRRITHCVAAGLNGFDGPYHYEKSWYVKMRAQLNLSTSDLLLESANKFDPMVTDPITWVNDQIQKFNQSQEEVYA